MHDDRKDILWATDQIRKLVNTFEGKTLPVEAVGAIEGWCNRIDRESWDISIRYPGVTRAQKS